MIMAELAGEMVEEMEEKTEEGEGARDLTSATAKGSEGEREDLKH